MEQTPLRDYYNTNVLSLIPKNASRVVEVGCGGGTMAREYRKIDPSCDSVGIETIRGCRPRPLQQSFLGNIEQMDEETFDSLLPRHAGYSRTGSSTFMIRGPYCAESAPAPARNQA